MLLSTRITLLAMAAGLLTILGAQAQSSPTIVNTTIASKAYFAQATTNNDQPTTGPITTVAAKVSSPPPPEASAAFYNDSHKDLSQSLAWMQETNSILPTYWNLYTEARIRLKMKDYQGARTTAEQAYELAVKAMPASKEYVALSANMVAQVHLLAKQ